MIKLKNALIFGSGSKFGNAISQTLSLREFCVYGVSSTAQTENTLTVNWNNCFINNFEKFLGGLPKIDLVIFNQNSSALNDSIYNLGSTPTLDVWKQSKEWTQSHYVNCVLPMHTLNKLAGSKKIDQTSIVAWMLSSSMFDAFGAPVDYVGQKYQNYIMLQRLADTNPQTFVGICPGKLTNDVYNFKSQLLIDLLTNSTALNGGLYMFDPSAQNFKLFKNQEIKS